MTLSYSLRKSLGICVVCPCKAADGSIRCEFHRAQHARRALERVTKERARLSEAGRCVECRCPSARYRCDECGQKHKEQGAMR